MYAVEPRVVRAMSTAELLFAIRDAAEALSNLSDYSDCVVKYTLQIEAYARELRSRL